MEQCHVMYLLLGLTTHIVTDSGILCFLSPPFFLVFKTGPKVLVTKFATHSQNRARIHTHTHTHSHKKALFRWRTSGWLLKSLHTHTFVWDTYIFHSSTNTYTKKNKTTEVLNKNSFSHTLHPRCVYHFMWSCSAISVDVTCHLLHYFHHVWLLYFSHMYINYVSCQSNVCTVEHAATFWVDLFPYASTMNSHCVFKVFWLLLLLLFPMAIKWWKYDWGEHGSPHAVVKVIIAKHIEITQNGQEHHHVAC